MGAEKGTTRGYGTRRSAKCTSNQALIHGSHTSEPAARRVCATEPDSIFAANARNCDARRADTDLWSPAQSIPSAYDPWPHRYCVRRVSRYSFQCRRTRGYEWLCIPHRRASQSVIRSCIECDIRASLVMGIPHASSCSSSRSSLSSLSSSYPRLPSCLLRFHHKACWLNGRRYCHVAPMHW